MFYAPNALFTPNYVSFTYSFIECSRKTIQTNELDPLLTKLLIITIYYYSVDFTVILTDLHELIRVSLD